MLWARYIINDKKFTETKNRILDGCFMMVKTTIPTIQAWQLLMVGEKVTVLILTTVSGLFTPSNTTKLPKLRAPNFIHDKHIFCWHTIYNYHCDPIVRKMIRYIRKSYESTISILRKIWSILVFSYKKNLLRSIQKQYVVLSSNRHFLSISNLIQQKKMRESNFLRLC